MFCVYVDASTYVNNEYTTNYSCICRYRSTRTKRYIYHKHKLFVCVCVHAYMCVCVCVSSLLRREFTDILRLLN